MIETGLHRTEGASAFQEKALIEEARQLHRRRQRKQLFRLIVAVLLIGIVISTVILFISRSQTTTPAPQRITGQTAPGEDTAYITTSEGILEVDLATKLIVKRIIPHGGTFALNPIAIAPGDRMAYVVSDNVMTPINLTSGVSMTPVTVGPSTAAMADGTGYPGSIAITPNGRTAYVAIPGLGTIVPVHLSPLSSASPIVLGGTPHSIAIAPNGETAYVTNSTANAVDVVDLATGAVHSITGIADPQEIALTPNGQRAYVTAGSAIVPIDLASATVLTPLEEGSMDVGFLPRAIVVSKDGQRLYVANLESATGNAAVLVVSTRSNTIIARLGRFSAPVGLSLVAGGHTLYVVNDAPSPGQAIGLRPKASAVEDNALVPIDLAKGFVQTPIRIPVAPRAFGIGQR
jgi:DNA-binding beta-propeller fold protein YncE